MIQLLQETQRDLLIKEIDIIERNYNKEEKFFSFQRLLGLGNINIITMAIE
jgi:hypothetical protein